MRMVVTTPLDVIADIADVRLLSAEDETGSFGILPGHADFLTVLGASVISWRNGSGEEHHVAVSGGVLSVRDGDLVEIAAHEAFSEDTLKTLGGTVRERFREQSEAEQEAWTTATRLQLATIRSIERYVSGERAIPAGAMAAGQEQSRFGDVGEGQ